MAFEKTETRTLLSTTKHNARNPLRSDKKASYYAFARNEVVDAIVQTSIPAGQILEIGCAGGATGKRIKELMPVQHYVGIEISEEAAAIARQHLDQVIVANIENTDLSTCGLVHESFDLILALDVLEHLYDPWDALSTLLGYLKPGGHVVASIPNIQNVSILRNLLKGVWKYEDAGILDATHLRFFAFDQISELFSGAGLTISRIDSILNPPIDVNSLHAAGNSFSLDKVHFTDLSKEEIVRFYTYQYLVIAQKGSGVADEQTSPKPVTPVLNAYPIGSSAPKPHRALTPELPSKPGKELAHGMVSIVILTFNQLKYTKECIESIRRHTPEAHEIIFVDNGSTDGTVKWLKKLLMENPNYSLIENGKNLGFAKGCNQGIEAASGEYILLLNNDVVVTEDWLSGMMACLNSAPDAGIVGPMTNSISGPQKVETVGYSTTKQLEDYSKDFREQNRHRRIPIRRVVGFCMLFKHALVEQIGLLDESFGSGNFEDDDFCLRAALEGCRNLIAGDVFIHHYGSRSFIGNKIDYGSAMSKNKKLFSEKWTGIDGSSPLGRKILTVGAMERASEFHQQDQIDKAIESALKAIGHSPDEKRTYHALAELLIDAKRFADAIEALSEMPTDDQDSRRLELIGYCKEGLELYSEAEDFADRALALNPASASALNLKGILAYKREDKDASEAHFQKAILCDPGYGEPYTNLGVLKWAAGNTEEGFNLLERGFILSPTVMDIVTLYHSALTADAAFERAERIFRDANTLHPASRRLKFLLIDILLQQGKFEEAMQLVEGAMIAFGTDDGIVSAALAIREKIVAKEIAKASKNKGTLSLCMIVKDEEEYLPKCLASVKSVVDEMIIVDTGSTDRTVDIAKAFGAQVYDFEWTNSFSDARNFSLSKASGDWVLVLDGDEVISPMDHRLLANIVRKKSSKPIAYSFDTRNYTYVTHVKGWTGNDGKYAVEEAGTGWMPSRKVRLFINNKLVRFEGVVHELLEHSLASSGIPIRYCNIPIHHYGHLNVQDNISKGKAYYALGKDKLAGNENDFQALVELARQANELGEYENAIELWQKVIDLNPNYVDGFLNLGFSHIQLDQYEAALAASEKAITLAPNMKEVVLNYSNCQMVIGDAKKAIAVLQNLFEKEPEYPAAMGVIAAAYFIDHQKDKGLEYLDKIRRKGYDGARTLYVYAKKLVSTGRTNDAILLLEPAQDQNVLDKDVFSLLLECYKARNDAAQSTHD
jgi:O-antigen biosynthesis protein